MPAISMFYGLINYLCFFDNKQHNPPPHIHAKYQSDEAIISIPGGNLLDGNLPQNKMKLVLAWIEIHKDELMADWQLACDEEAVFKIDGLK